MISERLEYTAYNAVLTANLYTYLLLVCIAGIVDCIGLNDSVFKLNTADDLLHVFNAYVLVEENMIDFLLQIFRMHEFRGHVTIVGE